MDTYEREPLPFFADDLCVGTKAIGDFLNKTGRQAEHLCVTRQIPAFKEGGKWNLRKSTYARHIAKLENASPGRRWRRRPGPQAFVWVGRTTHIRLIAFEASGDLPAFSTGTAPMGT